MAHWKSIDIDKVESLICNGQSANQISRQLNTCSEVIYRAVKNRLPQFHMDTLRNNGQKRYHHRLGT
jgi:hypothetical protein